LIVERLRELLPLLPKREYGSVHRALRAAMKHINTLEARVAEQEKHLAMLRAQVLKARK
jgi:hypothetical protein